MKQIWWSGKNGAVMMVIVVEQKAMADLMVHDKGGMMVGEQIW